MGKKFVVLAVALATALALAAPVSGATSDDADFGSQKAAVAQGEFNSYIVVMKADPLVVTEGKENLNSNRAKARGKALANGHANVLKDAGLDDSEIVQNYVNALNGFSATLTHGEATKVAGHPDVAFVVPDELQQKTTDSSPTFIGLDDPAGPWSTGYDGEGVIVGVIDTGIWPEHPSFADDGTFPDPGVTVPCEFGNTAHNPDDAPFTCNNKLLGARQMLTTYRAFIGADPDEFDSARDDDGHGTHTASTAAGNADVNASIFGQDLGAISGIAPRAHVIAYKGLGNLGGFTSDLAAAIDQAVADGVDVINYSIGGGAGGPSADEIAFLFAADAGVFVATSAGNSGPGAATLGNPGTMPWMTTVGASTQSRFFQGTVHLGDGTSFSGASVTPGAEETALVDAEFAGGDLCVPGELDPNVVSGNIVLCRRGAIARAAKSLAVQQAGGVGMIMYNNSDADNLFTDNHWVSSVHIDNTPGLAIKSYIGGATDPTASITTGELATWDSAPSMTIFSSRGPNPVAGDIIKPDITAPGLQILAGASPFPDPMSTPPGELFQAIAGTSMSSPHIAGVFALIKQAHPDWSPAAARSAIMTTAYQDVVDNDRVSAADPFDYGSGHVDPGNRVHKGSAFQPGLVYDAGFNEYLGFLCDAFPEVFANPDATCAALAGAGIPTDASDLNYPSIAVAELAGTQTVTRTMTSVSNERGIRTYDVSVDAPAGYSVTVSPSTIQLRRGQTASYEVTITNVSAPIGQWRFGSLTWSDRTDHYDVYSPIAVNASLLDAPSEIDGSGESGTVGFDVTFGYTGSYTAAAHGLEPATVTSDNVVQDPDQSFDPSDLGNGANLHQFVLSGAALFRIAMPPEATEPNADLDIFVFDPDGNLAATSTSGGTNELIDLALPADGTWDVYVHGWSTPGGDSDYDMWTWAIPLTPGTGNLAIDSAPVSATLGATESITASWTGATAGQWHLGAVSHTGDAGLLGLTLVNVDNR